MITRLNIFDFDDTIIKVPGTNCMTDALMTYAILNNIDCPSINDVNNNTYYWWDSPISLDTGFFNFKAFPGLYKRFLEYTDGKSQNIVITHRVEHMKPAISKVLDVIHMQMPIYCGGRVKKEKVSILKEILELYPDVKYIRVIEDSIIELQKFKQFLSSVNIENQLLLINTKNIMDFNTMQVIDELHYCKELINK